ncbi:MAG: SAM-dependent methyltransferase [Planctomycetales bacterium]|nr:SAM-dependent methyltransferase [Planctomycetales bacterium]NIM08470.1 SAM-dependent methyltransferase [Planctomycetales bacterium]NIN07950.1 SAM-dependent methyltransferase [Planctomycetales bacterium]NIN77078.1 SAM-dependent methyltransferase [Planctomycetales bacterium]NIO34256.1 SAM-dependent methyltransferase [Planctomycetales bacterium]
MAARHRSRSQPSPAGPVQSPLRIIGGRLRGRKLLYSGRRDTRPMKDRVREALFNLVGPSVRGQHAIDLFAGTGALGLEAISRGARSATFVEQHIPTARLIQQNIELLGLTDACRVERGDAFFWSSDLSGLPATAWLVLCSPPYDFYVSRTEQMVALIDLFLQQAPAGSTIVVEADPRFDFQRLPHASQWDVRPYPPAVLGIYRLPPATDD